MELIHDFKSKTEECIRNGYTFKSGEYIRRGWELFRMRMDYFLLFTLIFFIGISIPVLDLFIVQPLGAGFIIASYYLASGKSVIIDDFLEGFKYFAGLLLFTLVAGLLVMLGYIALVLPGIYLTVAYIFTPFYIIFAKMDFWESMEMSRKLIHREWFSVFGFIILLILINLLGVMAFGIGLFITVPLSYCALYAAFDDVIGVRD